MSAVLTCVSTGGWNYTYGVSTKWHTVIMRSIGGWDGTHALSPKHGIPVMLRFMHTCMKKKSHPQMAGVHPVGHQSVVQRNRTVFHCYATHLHCVIMVVQRICTVSFFFHCCATHLHCVIIVVQGICTVSLLLCNAIPRFMDGLIHIYMFVLLLTVLIILVTSAISSKIRDCFFALSPGESSSFSL